MAELVSGKKKQEEPPRHQAPVRPAEEMGAEKELPHYPPMPHWTRVESEMAAERGPKIQGGQQMH